MIVRRVKNSLITFCPGRVWVEAMKGRKEPRRRIAGALLGSVIEKVGVIVGTVVNQHKFCYIALR